MPTQIQHFMRRVLAVLTGLTLVAALTGCDQINDWLFSPPSSAPASGESSVSESAAPESVAPESSGDAPVTSNPIGEAPASAYLTAFTPSVCRDAALAEILSNNPLDRSIQKGLDGGADIEQTLTEYADYWEQELGHAIELTLTAADDEQKAHLERAQETWSLFVADELMRQDALAGAWKDSARAKLSSQYDYDGPALCRLALYRERALAIYETYYILESAQRSDGSEVQIQFLFDAD